ncbi:ImmA/IrrE family metallo-endopeptidase [Desulfotruncus alcoholivorax]|uniref:ImmA/IrrE family metallo-endopeptidase n=1 Tax=Desulfotruncus alcoholivorax TaxID=265477 RepID=UPI0012FF56C1
MAFGIYSHTVQLPGSVAAFVYYSKKGRYHIFVSSDLSPESQREVFLHELYHVIKDMPRKGYILGIDMYREQM